MHKLLSGLLYKVYSQISDTEFNFDKFQRYLLRIDFVPEKILSPLKCVISYKMYNHLVFCRVHINSSNFQMN